MELMIERANVWAASIQDEPGRLAAMLARLGVIDYRFPKK
jgi:hypothetical protein